MEFLTGLVLFLVVCILGYLAYETYVSFNGPLNKTVLTTDRNISTSSQAVPTTSSQNNDIVTTMPAIPARPVSNVYTAQYT